MAWDACRVYGIQGGSTMNDERAMLLAWIEDAENMLLTAHSDRWRFLALDGLLATFVGAMAVACVFWAIEATSGLWRAFFGGASLWNAWALATVLVRGREGWCMFRQMELGTRARPGLARERLDELGDA